MNPPATDSRKSILLAHFSRWGGFPSASSSGRVPGLLPGEGLRMSLWKSFKHWSFSFVAIFLLSTQKKEKKKKIKKGYIKQFFPAELSNTARTVQPNPFHTKQCCLWSWDRKIHLVTSLTRRDKVPMTVWSPVCSQSSAEHCEALALLAADLLPAGKGCPGSTPRAGSCTWCSQASV